MDDQQARDAAAKALHDAQWEHSRYHPEWDNLGHGRSGSDHIVEAQAHANAAIDAYLAALPVAPEQPTQANEEERRVKLSNRFLDHLDPHDNAYGPRMDALIEEADRLADIALAALVSSPSVETVTPDRETIIREVIDWIAGLQVPFSPSYAVARMAREHFGVSS